MVYDVLNVSEPTLKGAVFVVIAAGLRSGWTQVGFDGEGKDIKERVEKIRNSSPFFMQTLGEVTENVMGDESLLIPIDTHLVQKSAIKK